MSPRNDPRQPLSVDDVRALASDTLNALEPGDDLDERQAALIRFAVASSTTALNIEGMDREAKTATQLGVSTDELVCVLLLVAPIGMHTLHEGMRTLAELLPTTDPDRLAGPLTDEQSALKGRLEGDSSYWNRLGQALPGFLDTLLRLAPNAYQRFFEFCALAWETDALDPMTKELVYLAIDATPTHRYGPGFGLHLHNAVRLGARGNQIEQTLALAAAAPGHIGVRW